MGWFLTLISKMTGHRIPGELLLSSTVHYTLYSVRAKLQRALFNCKYSAPPPLIYRGWYGCRRGDRAGAGGRVPLPGGHGDPGRCDGGPGTLEEAPGAGESYSTARQATINLVEKNPEYGRH